MLRKSIVISLFCFNFIHSKMPQFFETRQLKAERATDNHASYIAQITSHDKIQETYMTGKKEDFIDVSKQLSIINKQWDEYDYGLYIIFDKENSDFIGFAGFHSVVIDENKTINFFNINNTPEVEIYFFLMPHHWRKGYGFEIASKLMSLAFKRLACASIIAYIEPKNEASLNLIKKLNFKEETGVIYNDKVHKLYRFNKQ